MDVGSIPAAAYQGLGRADSSLAAALRGLEELDRDLDPDLVQHCGIQAAKEHSRGSRIRDGGVVGDLDRDRNLDRELEDLDLCLEARETYTPAPCSLRLHPRTWTLSPSQTTRQRRRCRSRCSQFQDLGLQPWIIIAVSKIFCLD
jgi:hypothetical protein